MASNLSLIYEWGTETSWLWKFPKHSSFNFWLALTFQRIISSYWGHLFSLSLVENSHHLSLSCEICLKEGERAKETLWMLYSHTVVASVLGSHPFLYGVWLQQMEWLSLYKISGQGVLKDLSSHHFFSFYLILATMSFHTLRSILHGILLYEFSHYTYASFPQECIQYSPATHSRLFIA